MKTYLFGLLCLNGDICSLFSQSPVQSSHHCYEIHPGMAVVEVSLPTGYGIHPVSPNNYH